MSARHSQTYHARKPRRNEGKMNEIAIASIPVQPWETPLEPQQALCSGTIFRELHKPFFIEEKMSECTYKPRSEMEKQLLEIQQTSFYLYDLLLYLDTHPGEKEAAEHYDQTRQKRKELMKEFASCHYPLTMDCEGCQTAAAIPWDVPGTEAAMTIIPQDQSCCKKGEL